MRARWFLTAILFALAFNLSAPIVRADDASGCDGLGKYREAMLKAGRDHQKRLDRDNLNLDRDLATFSSDDWEQFGKDFAKTQKALKKIKAPEFATDWHQTQIEWAGLSEQLAKTAEASGLIAAVALGESFDTLEKDKSAALKIAVARCADFAAFQAEWAALDSTDQGTPSPTPTL